MKNSREYCIDNKWVVPYHPFFSLKYGAHINVEVVNSVEEIKYLYKYVTKGHDKVTSLSRMMQDKMFLFMMKSKPSFTHDSASEAYW